MATRLAFDVACVGIKVHGKQHRYISFLAKMHI